MENDILVLTLVTLAVLTWFVYQVKKTIEVVYSTHEQVEFISNEVITLGFMLGTMMNHLSVPHPDHEPETSEPNISVDDWDNL